MIARPRRRTGRCRPLGAIIVGVVLGAFVSGFPEPAKAQVILPVGDTTPIGGAMQYDVYRNRDAVTIPLPNAVQGLRFRVRLATYDPPASPNWSVEIGSSTGATYIYSGRAFATSEHDILTAVFPAGNEYITLRSVGEAPPLHAVEAIVYRSPPAPLSTVDTTNRAGAPNKPNYLELDEARSAHHADAALLARLNAAADAMVRLEIKDVLNRLVYACSGILVANDIVMTNHHCLTEPKGTELRIRGWLHGRSPDSGADAPTFQTLAPISLNLNKTSAPRYADIALLKTSGSVEDVRPAKLAPKLPDGLKALVVLQYPNIDGSSSLLRINEDEDCVLDKILALRGTRPRPVLKHGCDTDRGSSGSPVWPRSLESGVVGLHYWGHNKNERQQNRAELMPDVLATLMHESDPAVKSLIKFQKELP